LGNPGRLEIQGALRLSPAPIDVKAQERGPADDHAEWLAIMVDLFRPPDGRDTKQG